MSFKSLLLITYILVITICVNPAHSASTAKYAEMSYDVVYVRCPRAHAPVNWLGKEQLENWNGVNDMWLSASNNIYHQPGCDLMLHKSNLKVEATDRGELEEVLVDCDEDKIGGSICTIVDPNVSLDGEKIIYSKFIDTRNFTRGNGGLANGGAGSRPHHGQSYVNLYLNSKKSKYGKRSSSRLKPFDAPSLIFIYDLKTKKEIQVSPPPEFFGYRAYAGKSSAWKSNFPVMDTSPFFITDNKIGFVSNRDNGFQRFELFTMDIDGKNLSRIGHRAMNQQLHPAILADGRIQYTSFDTMLQKSTNNQYSLFTILPNGSFPFILAGKHDAARLTYHFSTQLSDGDIVSSIYYNHNNGGMGSLIRFPANPPGPDFTHSKLALTKWRPEGERPFRRVKETMLTPNSTPGDVAMKPYSSVGEYWHHPGRIPKSKKISIDGQIIEANKKLISMNGRFAHPSGAPNNELLVTYTIGASSTMGGYKGNSLQDVFDQVGKDAGIWVVPLKKNSREQIKNIATDAKIVVDFPEYHEIMPRALTSYESIYGVRYPGRVNAKSFSNKLLASEYYKNKPDIRLNIGEPFGLTGAATLNDRETRALNGVPWNAKGVGNMSGRAYTNLATSGADLAIFSNLEIAGIRVLLPIPNYPSGKSKKSYSWVGLQQHNLKILGEHAVSKKTIDAQGNPDTSFLIKLPANTPFLFQTIDKNGMALDIETTSRTVTEGEQQLCSGCHVHTRDGINPRESEAFKNKSLIADFTGKAMLFSGINEEGIPTSLPADKIYDSSLVPGLHNKKSFAVDWNNGIANIINKRCASCHSEGEHAQVLTGLRLDGDHQTYDLLVRNKYTREDGKLVNHKSKPGDGFSDVIKNTLNTDRIVKRQSCCTASRWISFNSARSSMLAWALYGERLDGRNPTTGLPWGAKGEGVPKDRRGLTGVQVDPKGLDKPEVWPRVSEHLGYLKDMPDKEKRLITRWIDLGCPIDSGDEDLIRPVLTVTPVVLNDRISSVIVGLWDDSGIDYATFKVEMNGQEITPLFQGQPSTVSVKLMREIDVYNADDIELTFEVWDKANHMSVEGSAIESSANRVRKNITGRRLLELAGLSHKLKNIETTFQTSKP